MENDGLSIVQQLAKDHRIGTLHIALITAMLCLANNEYKSRIKVSRRELMRLSKIRSVSTYHKCLKQLVEFSYVIYYPSYHPGIRSEVLIKSSSKF